MIAGRRIVVAGLVPALRGPGSRDGAFSVAGLWVNGTRRTRDKGQCRCYPAEELVNESESLTAPQEPVLSTARGTPPQRRTQSIFFVSRSLFSRSKGNWSFGAEMDRVAQPTRQASPVAQAFMACGSRGPGIGRRSFDRGASSIRYCQTRLNQRGGHAIPAEHVFHRAAIQLVRCRGASNVDSARLTFEEGKLRWL